MISDPQKIVSIHQPNYIPWIGFFYKMARADIFVLLDDVRHSKSSVTHRNKIKSNEKELQLSIPLKNKESLINDLIIQDPKKNLEKHFRVIENNYIKAKHWDYFSEELFNILSKDWNKLIDINIALINAIKKKLNINCDIILASDLNNIVGRGNDRNLSICKSLNAKTYLSGLGAKAYNNEESFKREGINITYTDLIHLVYPQLGKNFIPNLSVLDLLFNCGTQSSSILLKS